MKFNATIYALKGGNKNKTSMSSQNTNSETRPPQEKKPLKFEFKILVFFLFCYTLRSNFFFSFTKLDCEFFYFPSHFSKHNKIKTFLLYPFNFQASKHMRGRERERRALCREWFETWSNAHYVFEKKFQTHTSESERNRFLFSVFLTWR